MQFGELVQPLLDGKHLSHDQAVQVMLAMMEGELTPSQLGSVLTLLRQKGVTGTELAAFAKVLRERSLKVHFSHNRLVDTCGTGGGIPSFNLSTAAMFVAAGAGAMIAKHGNRAITSRCGSADVLEHLGVKLQDDPEKVANCLDEVGVAFMLAPVFHPALKTVGPVRRELQFRTVFNQLGPLLNPASANAQIIGVYHQDLLGPMAQALIQLGVEHGFVVHSSEGMDEISACGDTQYVRIAGRSIYEGTFHPSTFGMKAVPYSALLPGETISENADILREAITDVNSARARAILPNAACAIWLSDLATDFADCAELARQSIASGAAIHKLDALVEASNS